MELIEHKLQKFGVIPTSNEGAEVKKDLAPHERIRLFGELPGTVQKIGKSIVIFAHPVKALKLKRDAEFLAFGDFERLARMLKGKAFGVAFVPFYVKDNDPEKPNRELMRAYSLPVECVETGAIKRLLRERKTLPAAGPYAVSFVTGRDRVEHLLPQASRARLERFLRGECPCCGHASYPNLLERTTD